MRTLAQYAPALVLAAWAALWAAGITGDTVIAVASLALIVAMAAHLEETLK